jgi:hypothetical protein
MTVVTGSHWEIYPVQLSTAQTTTGYGAYQGTLCYPIDEQKVNLIEMKAGQFLSSPRELFTVQWIMSQMIGDGLLTVELRKQIQKFSLKKCWKKILKLPFIALKNLS